MMSTSLHVHMVRVKDEYGSCHSHYEAAHYD